MTGWKVIAHALAMLWRNRAAALRIGALPAAIVIVASFVLRPAGAGAVPEARSLEQVLGAAFSSEAEFLLMLVWVFASVWMFVNWHRYILLEAHPGGWLPAMPRAEMLGYAATAARLLGLGLFALFTLIFVTAVLGEGVLWLFLPGVVAIGFVLYRMSVALPAAALGRPIGLIGAVAATRGMSLAILMVMAFRYALGEVADAVIDGAAGIAGAFGVVIFGIVTLILGLIHASIVTTLYGHCVEGREIG